MELQGLTFSTESKNIQNFKITYKTMIWPVRVETNRKQYQIILVDTCSMQIKTYAENIRRLFVSFFYTKKEKQQLNQKGTSCIYSVHGETETF